MSAVLEYPVQHVTVRPFDGSLAAFFTRPPGQLQDWPLDQVEYLAAYLKELDCRSIVDEAHYLDRDYIEDLSLFYSRSLRNYPNYCRRLHFFSRSLTPPVWRALLRKARTDYEGACRELNESYLGFTVIRPLPGRPVGRTVLKTLGPKSKGGTRQFHSLREYQAHLSGLELRVTGIAFQQQDQAVSACATTATWTALQAIAHRERLVVRTPAEITLAASRYLLVNGRTLPSEGLAIQQICEAVRDAGLAPALLRATSFGVDLRALDTFLRSGFPAVLAVTNEDEEATDEGHAICAVGAKVGDVLPQSNPKLNYRDGATALKALYVHDDRLGPYAAAALEPLTVDDNPAAQTSLHIRWPGAHPGQSFETWKLFGIVVPLPNKVRLSVTRLREIGHVVGQSLGTALPEMNRTVTIRFRYCTAVQYTRESFTSGLSQAGLLKLVQQTALSRYIAIVEVTGLGEPLIDVVLDCTEAVECPSVIAVINRSQLPEAGVKLLRALASSLAAPLIH
jgi:hypothetical protein